MSTRDRILRRVRASGRGSVFTPSDFLDLGNRAAVDQALSRLARQGVIRRLSHGLYDYPRVHPQLGVLTPSADAVAKALAKETGSVVQVAGAQAANALGLSTQVPAHAVYLTDGPSRHVAIGRRRVDLRHASRKFLVAPGTKAGTVVQALRYLGKDAAPRAVDVVAPTLSAADRRVLAREATKAPGWLRPVLDRLAQPTAG